MGEKRIEEVLRERVKVLGGLAIKMYCLSFTGMPDRLVLVPPGRVYFVELKSEGKTPSPRQRIVRKWLISRGFRFYLVDSREGLNDFLSIIQGEQLC